MIRSPLQIAACVRSISTLEESSRRPTTCKLFLRIDRLPAMAVAYQILYAMHCGDSAARAGAVHASPAAHS